MGGKEVDSMSRASFVRVALVQGGPRARGRGVRSVLDLEGEVSSRPPYKVILSLYLHLLDKLSNQQRLPGMKTALPPKNESKSVNSTSTGSH